MTSSVRSVQYFTVSSMAMGGLSFRKYMFPPYIAYSLGIRVPAAAGFCFLIVGFRPGRPGLDDFW